MIEITRPLLAFVLLPLLLTSTYPQSTSYQGQQAINISSGKIQITAPSGWKTAVDLNDSADLQAVNVKDQLYLIVLTDNKIDYTNMTVGNHAKETLDTLTKAMTSFTTSGPTSMRVGGNPAVQYEVRGVIKNLNVVYLHTTVETSAHYHQIVTWQLLSSYELRKGAIQDIIRSFKEIGP